MGMNTNCYGVVSDVVIMINTDLAGNERTKRKKCEEKRRRLKTTTKTNKRKPCMLMVTSLPVFYSVAVL